MRKIARSGHVQAQEPGGLLEAVLDRRPAPCRAAARFAARSRADAPAPWPLLLILNASSAMRGRRTFDRRRGLFLFLETKSEMFFNRDE